MNDRAPKPADPTAERTAESSTPTASGLSSGRPGAEQGRGDEEKEADVTPREGEDPRPRREDGSDRDPVMPADDPSLRTEI